jgi:hypothetical protein
MKYSFESYPCSLEGRQNVGGGVKRCVEMKIIFSLAVS